MYTVDFMPFLNFIYAALGQFIPFFVYLVCLFIPLFFIGSVPHIIKKVIFFWK